jgi:hypothetical protein
MASSTETSKPSMLFDVWTMTEIAALLDQPPLPRGVAPPPLGAPRGVKGVAKPADEYLYSLYCSVGPR